MCRREAAASSAADDSAGGVGPVAASTSEVAPEQPRVTLRLPPIVLAVPLLALAAFGVIHTEPWQPRTPMEERAAMPPAQDEALADGAGEVADDDGPEGSPGDVLGSPEPTAPTQPSEVALADTAPEREPPAPPQADPATATEARARARGERHEEAQLELARAREQVEVVVYYAQWCGYCTKARAYLAQRGIRSVEHDVDSDTRASERHRRLNPRGSVPTIEIDGQVLVGFSARSIERALDLAARGRLSSERGS